MDNRLRIVGTSEAPQELIDLVADTMMEHGPDGHCDGCEVIAEVAYQWRKRSLVPVQST